MAFQLNNNGWLTIPWAEYVGKDGSHGASFSSGWDDGNQATFNILVNWTDGWQAEQDILGISIFYPEPAPGFLARTPPVQHPYKPNLHAERIISAHPVKWNGKQIVQLPYGYGAGGQFGALSSYALWLISIGFVSPKYTIITDTDLQASYGGHEWYRWCEVNEIEHEEIVTREHGQFIWDASAPAGLRGLSFNAPTGSRFYSSILEVLWRRVPRLGLFALDGNSDLVIQNIRTTLGKVHDGSTLMWETFNGAPYNNANANGSKLRFASYNIEPISSPFQPPVQGLGYGWPNTYHNVRFKFHVWDPPSGDGVNFGHNLAPSPGPDGLWYLVKTVLGATIYPVGDLSPIFQLASD